MCTYSCLFKLFLFRVLLLQRRRPSLSPLASPRCRARSDDQDRHPLTATSPLRAHLASPRAHARILHAPSLPYSPRLPRMTSPFLSPCAPISQSDALFHPRSPNLRARCQDRVLCAPHLVVPPPSPLPPRQAWVTASLSPRTYHPPPTSLILPLAHRPTSYMCPLRWPTHRPRPPHHPPDHPGPLATLFTRVHASDDGLRVHAEAAVDDDADGDRGRGRDGASATGGLRGTTTASAAFARRP